MAESVFAPFSFDCQSCLKPIPLDDHCEISVHALAELSREYKCLYHWTGSNAAMENSLVHVASINRSACNNQDGLAFIVPSRQITDSLSGADFTFVSRGHDDRKKMSDDFKLQAILLDCICSNSEMEHPVCEDCTDTMHDLLDQELKVLNEDHKDYDQYIKQLQRQEKPNIAALEQELHTLSSVAADLRVEWDDLKREENDLNKALEEEKIENERLKEQKKLYHRQYCKDTREAVRKNEDKQSMDYQIAYAERQLKKLKNANIFYTTFNICQAGQYGIINSFRLGRLKSDFVDWWEFNAAWGQTALLLNALARKTGLTFERHHIVPFGSHSYMEELANNRILPLYCTDAFQAFYDQLDLGMSAFLDCLMQFQGEVESRDTAFQFPHKIKNGKLIEHSTGKAYSIKLAFNCDEPWTKALKFMLTNLWWGLLWVTSRFDN